MSRHEEKEKALNELFPIPPEGETYGLKMARHGFNLGASWADEIPRNGLVDIEKICEWIEDNIDEKYIHFTLDGCRDPEILSYKISIDFRKAMEE